MKKVLILKERYKRVYYDASTDELLHAACLHIVEERHRKEWYSYVFSEEALDRGQKHLLSKTLAGDGLAALIFLQERQERHEYEGFEIEPVREPALDSPGLKLATDKCPSVKW